MNILLETCQHPGILRVLYFGYLFLEILTVIIPIGLIIMLMIDFTKAVITSKDDVQVKSMKLVGKRIMYAVFLFATPWIISLIMGVIGDAGIDIGDDYTICLNTVKNISAGTDNIEKYDNLLEIEEKAKEEKRKEAAKKNNKINSGSANDELIADNIIKLAKGEEGHVGGTKYDGGHPSIPWCAFFVVWVLKHTEYNTNMNMYEYINQEGLIYSNGLASGTMPAFMKSNRSNMKFYKSEYYGGNYIPKKGDIIYFWFPQNNGGKNWNGQVDASHIGIVEYSRGDQVITVEGNTTPLGGNSSGSATNVVRSGKIYSLSNSTILGYGSWY